MIEYAKQDFVSYIGLEGSSSPQYYQLSVPHLVEQTIRRDEGLLSNRGALMVKTGKYTGRSPEDRFIVDRPERATEIAWGSINVPIEETVEHRVFDKMKQYLHGKELYIFDGYAGTDPEYALPVRFINELPAHNLFVHQLFVRPTTEQLKTFKPEYTVICVPGLKLDPSTDGVHSEAAILVDLKKKVVLIAATQYAGEMKKSIFSVMNYLMPDKNVLPMHCSANVGKDGKSALFFGLSGTGKTTLSADPDRTLIGDDEHGWSDKGIFNFEGGCYAKTIHLSEKDEPEIYRAIHFGALVENVIVDEEGIPDYDDGTLTENTRVGYPIHFITNADPKGMAPHPSAVIFLTADAYGVLPPVSKLTQEQAQYHFISGYTSKLAGTERGIKEPKAAFSSCFGEPFMPRPASLYAKMLDEKLAKHGSSVYLVNTGWQGGPYGVGKRISIPHTRAMITAILNGELDKVEFKPHPIFNVLVPTSCPSVPDDLLNPKASWSDGEAYDKQANILAEAFVKNFTKFENVDHLVPHGPQPHSLTPA